MFILATKTERPNPKWGAIWPSINAKPISGNVVKHESSSHSSSPPWDEGETMAVVCTHALCNKHTRHVALASLAKAAPLPLLSLHNVTSSCCHTPTPTYPSHKTRDALVLTSQRPAHSLALTVAARRHLHVQAPPHALLGSHHVSPQP